MKVCVLVSVLFLTACSGATPGNAILEKSEGSAADFSAHFEHIDGAFVLYDQNTGITLRHNPERCAVRLSPCSTFKIPNTPFLPSVRLVSVNIWSIAPLFEEKPQDFFAKLCRNGSPLSRG